MSSIRVAIYYQGTLKVNGKIVGFVAGGVVVGAAGTYILMQ